MRYEDLGTDYYERRADLRRQIAHRIGKLVDDFRQPLLLLTAEVDAGEAVISG